MKYLTLNKLLFLVLTAAVLFSSCFLFPQEEEDPIYGKFYNYPKGREDANGNLKINNSVASPVLLFIDSVAPGNYIGTVGSSSQITVKLPEEKFYTIVAVDKAAYEENGAQAFQFSAIAYYSDIKISITVKAKNTFGEGNWFIYNNTDYWVLFKNTDGSGDVFAVAAPNAKRVTVPVEFKKSYRFIPNFYKELKKDGKVVALIESDDLSQGDTVYTDKDAPAFTTYIGDPDKKNNIKPPESEDIKPAVFITNSSDKTVEVYLGIHDKLTDPTTGDDFALIAGRSHLFTGLQTGANVNDINFESPAWGRLYVGGNIAMQINKVYLIVLSGKDGNYSTAVTVEDAEKYFPKDAED